MSYAPIVVFAFNRLEPLKRCVASLLENGEAAESDLIVFVDGPRESKEGESEKVNAVREYVKTISGFKSLTYHFSEVNMKLASSIITGVTKVINEYGRAIVVEDDLLVCKNFLSFMNQGLEKYENQSKVFSICGYSNVVKIPKGYTYDCYFCPRSSSWGWATWRDRWITVDWSLEDWENVKSRSKAFNKWGGSDCFDMLKGWKNGMISSWAIRFCYAQFKQDKVSLFPVNSLIDNKGFDGEGTNCRKWSRFKSNLDKSQKNNFLLPEEINVNPVIRKSFLSYNTIMIRIYSRIMYFFYR